MDWSITLLRESGTLTVGVAVTLEGTIIQKSGLITGGKSSQTIGKKWEEKDVQGPYPYPYPYPAVVRCLWILNAQA